VKEICPDAYSYGESILCFAVRFMLT
jgi:hypothetical protein